MKSTRNEIFRFLIAGGVNTVVTYAIYLACLTIVTYFWAFSISFVVGVISAFVIYSSFVFRTKVAWRKIGEYPVVYVLQYVVGLGLLAVLVEYVGISERIAPLVSVLVLTPVAFAINKWFLTKRAK